MPAVMEPIVLVREILPLIALEDSVKLLLLKVLILPRDRLVPVMETAPPRVSIELLRLLKTTEPPVEVISKLPGVPKFRVATPAGEVTKGVFPVMGAIVILPVACKTILAPKPRLSNCPQEIVFAPVSGVLAVTPGGKAVPSNDPSPAGASMMVRVVGSSNNVPVFPLGAIVFTLPRNVRDCLPETSTKPPLPDCVPPRAVMLPKNWVV